jgi:hypothetical protein
VSPQRRRAQLLQRAGSLTDTSLRSRSSYQSILDTTVAEGPIQRDACSDDIAFATAIAVALRLLCGRATPPASGVSHSLQGNLCEFCAWKLGKHHWHLYRRSHRIPSNDSDPWRDFSKPGIDILAIDDNADVLFLIEIKSSRGDGSAAIAADQNSLKADFGTLFTGGLEGRVFWAVNEMVAHVRVTLQRNDLAEKVVDAIGHCPEECRGAHLIGVLVCQAGGAGCNRQTRLRLPTAQPVARGTGLAR